MFLHPLGALAQAGIPLEDTMGLILLLLFWFSLLVAVASIIGVPFHY